MSTVFLEDIPIGTAFLLWNHFYLKLRGKDIDSMIAMIEICSGERKIYKESLVWYRTLVEPLTMAWVLRNSNGSTVSVSGFKGVTPEINPVNPSVIVRDETIPIFDHRKTEIQKAIMKGLQNPLDLSGEPDESDEIDLYMNIDDEDKKIDKAKPKKTELEKEIDRAKQDAEYYAQRGTRW